MNYISSWNNPQEVDMTFNKWTKIKHDSKTFYASSFYIVLTFSFQFKF